MIIDLHCHTTAHSGCAHSSLREMVESAQQSGLDAMCVTEHDVTYSGERARKEVGAVLNGMALIRGVEISCHGPGEAVAHVLVFGCNGLQGPQEDPEELARTVRQEGAAMVLAHPFRYKDGAHRILDVLPIDAIEVDSGNVDGPAAEQARALAAEAGLPMVAGSDAHWAHDVARYVTKLSADVRTASELAEEIRAGRVSPARWNEELGDWE